MYFICMVFLPTCHVWMCWVWCPQRTKAVNAVNCRLICRTLLCHFSFHVLLGNQSTAMVSRNFSWLVYFVFHLFCPIGPTLYSHKDNWLTYFLLAPKYPVVLLNRWMKAKSSCFCNFSFKFFIYFFPAVNDHMTPPSLKACVAFVFKALCFNI